MFAVLLDRYVLGYYDDGLRQVQVAAQVLHALLRLQDAELWQHLQRHDVVPILYATDWFMCLFVKVIGWIEHSVPFFFLIKKKYECRSLTSVSLPDAPVVLGLARVGYVSHGRVQDSLPDGAGATDAKPRRPPRLGQHA